MDWERFIYWFTAQMPRQLGLVQGKVRKLQFNLCLSYNLQELKHLTYHLLPNKYALAESQSSIPGTWVYNMGTPSCAMHHFWFLLFYISKSKVQCQKKSDYQNIIVNYKINFFVKLNSLGKRICKYLLLFQIQLVHIQPISI